jgi:hypothetical protein
VASFRGGTVPILDGHLGQTLGYLAALLGEGDRLWFTGTAHDAELVARLALGPVPAGPRGRHPRRPRGRSSRHCEPRCGGTPAFIFVNMRLPGERVPPKEERRIPQQRKR